MSCRRQEKWCQSWGVAAEFTRPLPEPLSPPHKGPRVRPRPPAARPLSRQGRRGGLADVIVGRPLPRGQMQQLRRWCASPAAIQLQARCWPAAAVRRQHYGGAPSSSASSARQAPLEGDVNVDIFDRQLKQRQARQYKIMP